MRADVPAPRPDFRPPPENSAERERGRGAAGLGRGGTGFAKFPPSAEGRTDAPPAPIAFLMREAVSDDMSAGSICAAVGQLPPRPACRPNW